MNIKAIGSHVLFQFLDEVNTRNEFKKEATSSGIIIAGDTFDSSAKEARWGRIVAVGPDVKDVEVDDEILIPALRWTEGVKYEGHRFWMTKVEEIVARRKPDEPTLYAVGEWVIFQRKVQQRMANVGMIAVVEAADPAIRGTVVTVGAKVDTTQVQVRDELLFVDPNFADTAKHMNREFGFVRESTILAVTRP